MLAPPGSLLGHPIALGSPHPSTPALNPTPIPPGQAGSQGRGLGLCGWQQLCEGGENFDNRVGGGRVPFCQRTGDRLRLLTLFDTQTAEVHNSISSPRRLSQTPAGWWGRDSCVHFTSEQTEAGAGSERLSRLSPCSHPAQDGRPALCERNKGLVLPQSSPCRLALPGSVSAPSPHPCPHGPTEVRLFLRGRGSLHL